MRIVKGCLRDIVRTKIKPSRSNNGGRFVIQTLDCGHKVRKRKSAVADTMRKSQCWECVNEKD